MKTLLINIQEKIENANVFKYVDEDWGQLSDYGTAPPVKWPCILFDVTGVTYSDIGIDKTKSPKNRQQATGMITFSVANLKLANSSAKTSIAQKQNAWEVHDLNEAAHKLLQGFRPDVNCGALIRSGMRKIRRDDGVQLYQITYTFGQNDV